MLTYYIGNVREKRRLFRKYREGGANADNADILADFPLDGKVCIVLGDIPYGDMRVGEYLCYARALTSSAPLSLSAAKALLRKCGAPVSMRRKMRTLPRYLFRAVLLSAAVQNDTGQVWLNLDGIAYSHAVKSAVRHMLRRMMRAFAEVHVAVSDYRFIPRGARVMAVTKTDVVPGYARSASRPYGRLRLRRDSVKSDLILSVLNGHKTLLCDN